MDTRHIGEGELKDFELLFVNEYFNNGFNGLQAFKALRPEIKETSCAVQATRILKKPHILREIEKRRSEIVRDGKISTEGIIYTLNNLIKDCQKEKDRNHLIKAVDILNKMAGNYAQKVDVTSNGNQIGGEIKIEIIKPKED